MRDGVFSAGSFLFVTACALWCARRVLIEAPALLVAAASFPLVSIFQERGAKPAFVCGQACASIFHGRGSLEMYPFLLVFKTAANAT